MIVGDDLARQLGIGLDQAANAVGDLCFDQSAHRQYLVADIFELLIEALGDVSGDMRLVHGFIQICP